MRALRWAQPLVALLVVSGRLASGFECDGRVIPDAWLNDDYCDCPNDQSDEPATNACARLQPRAVGDYAGARFTCRDTKGYLPLHVSASVYGDGVCDCCDGSDEVAGLCPDECAKWAAAEAEAAAVREAAWAAGRAQLETYKARGAAFLAEKAKIKDDAVKALKDAEAKELEAENMKNALLTAEKTERDAKKAAAEAAVASALDFTQLPAGAPSRLRLLLHFAAANNDTGVEALMRIAANRLDEAVTDKTDDVEVLSCGLAASDVLYPPLQNAEDGASAEAASGDAAAGTGDASVQVEADGSSKSSSSSSPSFNDKLTALGNALGLSLTTEFDATLSQAIEKLPLKPPTPEAAAAAEETPSEAVADEATKAAPTTSAANAAQVALEEMATELAQELKKTAMLGEMTKAAAEDASHRGGSASKPRFTVEEVEEPSEWDTWRLPAAKEAEDAWRSAAAAKRSAKTAVDDATAAAVSSVAVERPEYAALGNQCFAKQNDGFEYKVCPFKDAKQDSVDLGKFKDLAFTPAPPSASSNGNAGQPAAKAAASAEVVTMTFDEGAKCWNGPKRSLKLTFTCGAVDELLEVQEPETCAYVATMTTPAACG